MVRLEALLKKATRSPKKLSINSLKMSGDVFRLQAKLVKTKFDKCLNRSRIKSRRSNWLHKLELKNSREAMNFLPALSKWSKSISRLRGKSKSAIRWPDVTETKGLSQEFFPKKICHIWQTELRSTLF